MRIKYIDRTLAYHNISPPYLTWSGRAKRENLAGGLSLYGRGLREI
jgi:hypothetical protein